MIFGTAGAAYGTAKAGIGIAGVGTFRPDLIMKVCRYCEENKAESKTWLTLNAGFEQISELMADTSVLSSPSSRL